MKPVAYGIDFGTTNSVVAVAWPDGSTEVVPTGENDLLRSAVFIDDGGSRIAGLQAIQQYLTRPGEATRLFMELKASLSHPSLGDVELFGSSVPVHEVAGVVLRHLKLVADRYTQSDTRNLLLGFPVAFPDAEGDEFDERQNLALDRLYEAAAWAGFETIVPLEEPAAAAAVDDAGTYMALDFGGGTFDVAVVRNANATEVLALTGTDVGGELLTARLFRAAISRPLGLEHPRMPNRYAHHASSLPSVLAALFEGDFELSLLRRYAPEYANVYERGFLFDLYQSVEQSKLALSENERTTLTLRRRGVDIHVPIERVVFEDAIQRDLDRVDAEIGRALRRAGIDRDEVELVTLTGGSSRIPAFRDRVEKQLPRATVLDHDPYRMVARGLADRATEVAW